MYVGPVYQRSTVGLRLFDDRAYHPISTRYTTLSVWLLMSGLCVLFSGMSVRPFARRAVIGLVVLQAATLAVFGFSASTPRSEGPEWGPSVRAASAACRRRAEEKVALAVAPFTFNVVGSCATLGLP
jgi:hypothetical protein